MSNTTTQVVGITGGGTQAQFTGVADAGDGTAGGLVTFSGITEATAKEFSNYVIYSVSLQITGTPAANGSVTSVKIDLVDLTRGTLAWDGTVTVDPTTDITIGDGDGDGDFSAGIVCWGDGDGDGEGVIECENIVVGSLANNDAITGDAAFSALANQDKPDGGVTAPAYAPIEFNRQRLYSGSSVDIRLDYEANGGKLVGWSDDTLKTPWALRVVTDTMVGNGKLVVKWGKRRIRD